MPNTTESSVESSSMDSSEYSEKVVSPGAGRRRDAIGELHLQWHGESLQVLAIDEVCFVANAEGVSDRLMRFILKTDAQSAAEPISHLASLHREGSEASNVEFQVLEVHESLVRCQFADQGQLPETRQSSSPLRNGEETGRQRRADGAHSRLATPVVEAEAWRTKTKRGGTKKIRNTMVGGGIAVLAAMGFMNATKQSDVPSSVAFESAAVATDSMPLNFSVDGRLQSLSVEVGDFVSKGQLIGTIDAMVESVDEVDSDADLEQLQQELLILEDGKKSLENAIKIARENTSLQLSEGQAYLEQLTAERDSSEARMQRLEPLIASGSISSSEASQLKSELESLQASLARHSFKLQQLELASSAADQGILVSESGVKPLAELEMKIELTKNEIDSLNNQQGRRMVSKPVELRASVAGVVESIGASIGEMVLAGKPAVGLRVADPTRVTAMLPFDSGEDVSVGSKVDVKLGRLGLASQGTVKTIEPSQSNGDLLITQIELVAGDSGLQDVRHDETILVTLAQ